ncbi:MAG: hypothetical protein KC502_15655 [Myxococcales bacterium]|nr:hypothetical protein [Myxococcales bacterium]
MHLSFPSLLSRLTGVIIVVTGIVAAFALMSVAMPNSAAAQCAVCGNPAFSSGDNDIARAFGDGSPKELRLSGALVYSYLEMADLYEGSVKLPPEDKTQWVHTRDWALRVHVMTLMLAVELPTGTTFQLIAPYGRADSTRQADGDSATTDVDGTPIADYSDYGLSDMEFRVRQRLNGLFGLKSSAIPQMVFSAGVGAPTGKFIVKNSEDAVSDQYVSLGRGAWWVLADLDFFGRINDTVGWSLTNGFRHALTENINDGYLFRWGTEVRSSLSANFAIVPGVLNAALSAELQWRDTGKERFAEGEPIEDFRNGGGTWLGINPTVQAVIGNGFSATATVRIPLYRDVNGFQPVPGIGGVLALNWSWDSAPADTGPKPALSPGDKPVETEVAQALVAGKTTIVEYGAAWCAVCKKLKPKLVAFAGSRDDVVFRHVDVTDWKVGKMKRVLPAQPGLPVVDVYGPDGRLIRRLWGQDAFGFASLVPAPK